MRKADSVPALPDLFESSERIVPESIFPLKETTHLAFVLRAPADETVIDIWETNEGIHLCCTSSVCYRLSQVFRHYSGSFLFWILAKKITDGDTQVAA